MRIAIDGPAAAGKSTVAKLLAKELGYLYIDTGAMYRALTLAALKSSVDLEKEHELVELANDTSITFQAGADGQQEIYVNEINVSKAIRDKDVTNHVSIVAKHRLIREKMVSMQQQLAEKGNVVMDGRDIGTHVLPNAEVKIFLIASVTERAERRHKENVENGFDSDLETLKDEIRKRDQLDSERDVSPLVKADDAIELDTTSMSINEVKDQILSIVIQKEVSEEGKS
ncbi:MULTISPECIES: (d)CMP kinase [Allobacillus]|uniref:Cytidylate kinase n=1 Tax=Allobacillus halotolerans TaxID=570278 RepID=A0ABS6GJY4_9BACI|nr:MULTISPECIES: (d)CMP kinase [Allobacillus]MBU6079528.1 (d)CMP kinase [Allobacillus halotolerans]TSJ69018.1 (d)CMP kinase [Allobacillus sp. SKP2-8]